MENILNKAKTFLGLEDEHEDEIYEELEPTEAFQPKASSKIIPINKKSGFTASVNIIQPSSSEDFTEIADKLRHSIVIVNLREMTRSEGQRMIDRISGVLYALNGSISIVAENVFVLALSNFSVETIDSILSDESLKFMYTEWNKTTR